MYQLSSLVLEIFFEWMVIPKFLIYFCVWSIQVFSAPLFKKVYLKALIKIWVRSAVFFATDIIEKKAKMCISYGDAKHFKKYDETVTRADRPLQ